MLVDFLPPFEPESHLCVLVETLTCVQVAMPAMCCCDARCIGHAVTCWFNNRFDLNFAKYFVLCPQPPSFLPSIIAPLSHCVRLSPS